MTITKFLQNVPMTEKTITVNCPTEKDVEELLTTLTENDLFETYLIQPETVLDMNDIIGDNYAAFLTHADKHPNKLHLVIINDCSKCSPTTYCTLIALVTAKPPVDNIKFLMINPSNSDKKTINRELYKKHLEKIIQYHYNPQQTKGGADSHVTNL